MAPVPVTFDCSIHSISRSAVPYDCLLAAYSRAGNYVDCYTTEIAAPVTQSEYIKAFYTTPLFKLERFALKLAVAMPSTDDDARMLADGTCDTFAAWRVEKRNENELLLADFKGRTRSWLMSRLVTNESGTRTTLYFGSAVVPVRAAASGSMTLGPAFYGLLGFHKAYSRALLFAARSTLHERTAANAGALR